MESTWNDGGFSGQNPEPDAYDNQSLAAGLDDDATRRVSSSEPGSLSPSTPLSTVHDILRKVAAFRFEDVDLDTEEKEGKQELELFAGLKSEKEAGEEAQKTLESLDYGHVLKDLLSQKSNHEAQARFRKVEELLQYTWMGFFRTKKELDDKSNTLRKMAPLIHCLPDVRMASNLFREMMARHEQHLVELEEKYTAIPEEILDYLDNPSDAGWDLVRGVLGRDAMSEDDRKWKQAAEEKLLAVISQNEHLWVGLEDIASAIRNNGDPLEAVKAMMAAKQRFQDQMKELGLDKEEVQSENDWVDVGMEEIKRENDALLKDIESLRSHNQALKHQVAELGGQIPVSDTGYVTTLSGWLDNVEPGAPEASEDGLSPKAKVFSPGHRVSWADDPAGRQGQARGKSSRPPRTPTSHTLSSVGGSVVRSTRNSGQRRRSSSSRTQPSAKSNTSSFRDMRRQIQKRRAETWPDLGGTKPIDDQKLKLEDQLKTHQAKLKDLEELNSDMTKNLKDAETREHHLVGEREGWKTKEADQQRDIERLNTEADALQKAKVGLQEEIERVKAECDSLKKVMADLEKKDDGLQQDIQRLERENHDLQKAQDVLQGTEADLRQEMQRLTVEGDSLKKAMADLEKKDAGLQQDIEQLASKSERLQKAHHDLQITEADARKEMERLSEEGVSLKKAKADLAEENSGLQQAMDRLNIESESLRKAHDELRESESSLREERERLIAKGNSLKQASADLEETDAGLQRDIQRLRSGSEQLQKAYDALLETVAGLREEIERLTTETNELQRANFALQDTEVDLTKSIERLTASGTVTVTTEGHAHSDSCFCTLLDRWCPPTAGSVVRPSQGHEHGHGTGLYAGGVPGFLCPWLTSLAWVLFLTTAQPRHLYSLVVTTALATADLFYFFVSLPAWLSAVAARIFRRITGWYQRRGLALRLEREPPRFPGLNPLTVVEGEEALPVMPVPTLGPRFTTSASTMVSGLIMLFAMFNVVLFMAVWRERYIWMYSPQWRSIYGYARFKDSPRALTNLRHVDWESWLTFHGFPSLDPVAWAHDFVFGLGRSPQPYY